MRPQSTSANLFPKIGSSRTRWRLFVADLQHASESNHYLCGSAIVLYLRLHLVYMGTERGMGEAKRRKAADPNYGCTKRAGLLDDRRASRWIANSAKIKASCLIRRGTNKALT